MANISTDFSTWSGTAASNQPDSGDTATVQADLQAIQAALRTIFPSINAAVTPTHTELNYVDGVTSAIQTQLDAKVGAGANSNITSLSGLTTPLSKAQGGTGTTTGVAYQYGFSAYETSAQSVSSGVATQVTFGTEAFDDGGVFASSTFTAPVAGVYIFTACIRGNATSMTFFGIQFYKNGSVDQTAFTDNITALTTTLVRNVSQVYKLAQNDTIKIYTTITGTSPSVLNGAGAAASTFTGSLLYPT